MQRRLAADEPSARRVWKASSHLRRADGGALEEHGIWGSPAMVVDKIGRHAELGCDHLVIEFFGRDTREPARLFAAEVMPHL